MTDISLLKIGDVVSVSLNPQLRYDPYDLPDNATAVVKGFANEVVYTKRITDDGSEPGAYCQRANVELWLPDGRVLEHPHGLVISMMDQAEEMRRDAVGEREHDVRLGDFPDTEFWEGDIVATRYHSYAIVDQILYGMVRREYAANGTWKLKHEAYLIVDRHGVKIDGWPRLHLVDRGNLWRHYHGEPFKFSSKQEREEFLAQVGGDTGQD